MRNLEELIKLVGKPYQQENEDGNYIGCFEPLYSLYPKLPKFKLPKNKSDYFDFALAQIKALSDEVNIDDIQQGDAIVFKLPNEVLHLGIYLGDFKIIQTFKSSTMTINKINFDNKRTVGIYRFRKEV